MSDNILRLYPADPEFSPDPGVDARLLAEVARLYDAVRSHATDVEIERHERPHIVDGGVNLEQATCPRCGTTFSIHDWDGWDGWNGDDWEPVDWYADSTRVVPCCDATVRLDELRYSWPTGFARFSLDITNPFLGEHPWGDGDLGAVEARIVARFEPIVGARLERTWMHI